MMARRTPRSRSMTIRAHAKINLDLRILGTRPDGYHDLRTVFQTLALHDTLMFTRSSGGFAIRCRAAGVPTDNTNLMWKAAQALWSAAGREGEPRGVTVHLEKRIPVQGGLGGGSSDAAATLIALSRMWSAGARLKPGTTPDLSAVASSLGADVPFFLHGGTALGLGRGDEVYPLAEIARHFVVLLIPMFGVATKDAYSWVDDGTPHRQRTHSSFHPAKLDRVHVANDFEDVVADRHPLIRELRDRLAASGAVLSMLSGSGSAVYGLFTALKTAETAVRACRGLPCQALLTRTIGRREIR